MYIAEGVGPLTWEGGPDVACRFSKMAMLDVSVPYFPPCHMSNLRNSHVSCHYLFVPPCRMSLSLMSHIEFRALGP